MKTEGLKFSDKEIDEMIKFEIESGNPFAAVSYTHLTLPTSDLV